MKIGLIAPEFPPDIGGVQTYSWHMANELALLGHEVTVFTQQYVSGNQTDCGFSIAPLLKLRKRWDLSIIRDHTMDVWHSMNAPYAWLALEIEPVFVSVHGNDFLALYHQVARLDWRVSDRLDKWLGDQLTRRLVQKALPRARHVFANSIYTEKVFLQYHPACRGKTSVASVGVDDKAFATHEAIRQDVEARFITISRLEDPRKNLPAVLEALALLRCEHKFRYTIVGDGPLRIRLEELSKALELTDRVKFEGFVSHKRKIDLLRQSDLFVLPSLATDRSHEGFGLVYLEANACGTPVLAAPVGGAAEAVDQDVSGYFVETPTSEGVAAALGRFLRREITFEAEGCQGFARQFSWEAVAKHCVAQYENAL